MIFMDMRMPVVDGYEATRRIKASEQGKTTKIIAVTASVFDQDAEKVIAAGADEFLWKPFKAHDVFEKIALVAGVEYEYVEDASAEGAVQLTREVLSIVGGDVLRRMSEAIDSADADALIAIVDEIAVTQPAIAGALRALVEQYEYDRLAELL